MPNINNFDMTLGKSMTPVVRDIAFQSVVKRVGPKAQLGGALHHIPVEVTGEAVAKVKNARGSHFRDEAPLLVENAVRRRCVHVRNDVAPLEQWENGAHRRNRLADVDHHRQIERRGRLLRTTQSLKIVGAGDIM
jgi:hypothetical protein